MVEQQVIKFERKIDLFRSWGEGFFEDLHDQFEKNVIQGGQW